MSARAVGAGLLLEVRPLPMAAAVLTVLFGVGWARGDLRTLPPSTGPLVASVFSIVTLPIPRAGTLMIRFRLTESAGLIKIRR